METFPSYTSYSPVTSIRTSAEGAINAETIEELDARFTSSTTFLMVRNAVCKNPIEDIALNRAVLTRSDHTFSHVIDDWKTTNQKRSGRCWMFAGLNLLRAGAMQAMNLKEFEFSQNFPFFWDKLERANYFFERIIETADRPLEDRHVAHLLTRPIEDGGQWNMFVNIVVKYGLVPQSAMPETESSSNSGRMNRMLLTVLRQGARTIRDLYAKGGRAEELRRGKAEILSVVHRILSIHLGTPPSEFVWQWNDKDRVFHRDGVMTPKEFCARYVIVPLDEYVCLVNDPRPTSPVGKTFTVECLGNVEGGGMVRYLNVDISTMKDLAVKSIVGGEPVWFGSDVSHKMDRKLGIMDDCLYDYESVDGSPFDLDKSERLMYHETQMTHAMLFTGVDVIDEGGRNVPTRWRVENSWGEENGLKGFFLMNDNWFDQHMFEIAVRKSALPPELLRALDEEPIVLPPWDPMGALAR